MNPVIIDTPEDFARWRAQHRPVTLPSRTRGPIAVPCLHTLLVRRELIRANTYNPNHVPADKMRLLSQSIVDNGWCFPVVAIWDDADQLFTIVDGFHRDRQADPDWLDLQHLPLVVLQHDISQRMAATIQFNKARGVHQVDLDAQVIRKLLEQGMGEGEVAEHLGLSLETVHRLKQLTGVAELFARVDHSQPWEVVD